MQNVCKNCKYYVDIPFGYAFCNNEESVNYQDDMLDLDSCMNFEGSEKMKAFIKKNTATKADMETKSEEVVRKDKTSEILKHLKVNGSITSLDAIRLYGATRLSAIIFNLRKKGYDIQTQTEVTKDRYGHSCNYARYILNED